MFELQNIQSVTEGRAAWIGVFVFRILLMWLIHFTYVRKTTSNSAVFSLTNTVNIDSNGSISEKKRHLLPKCC